MTKQIRSSPGSVLAPFMTAPNLVRAYRLSDAAMSIYSNAVFTPQTLKQHGLTFENIFEELPVMVHNSDLSNVLLHQLGSHGVRSQCLAPKHKGLERKDQPQSAQTVAALQRHLRDLAICAEELAVDAGRSLQNCVHQARYHQAVQQFKSRHEAENRQRVARGEPVIPMTEEEINRNVRPPPTTNQLSTLLFASQLGQTAAESSRVSANVVQRNFAAGLLLNQGGSGASSN